MPVFVTFMTVTTAINLYLHFARDAKADERIEKKLEDLLREIKNQEVAL